MNFYMKNKYANNGIFVVAYDYFIQYHNKLQFESYEWNKSIDGKFVITKGDKNLLMDYYMSDER